MTKGACLWKWVALTTASFLFLTCPYLHNGIFIYCNRVVLSPRLILNFEIFLPLTPKCWNLKQVINLCISNYTYSTCRVNSSDCQTGMLGQRRHMFMAQEDESKPLSMGTRLSYANIVWLFMCFLLLLSTSYFINFWSFANLIGRKWHLTQFSISSNANYLSKYLIVISYVLHTVFSVSPSI